MLKQYGLRPWEVDRLSVDEFRTLVYLVDNPPSPPTPLEV